MMHILLLACADDVSAPAPIDSADPVTTAPVDPPLIALESPRLLRRLSLDLRGVVPTSEELDAAEADRRVGERLEREQLRLALRPLERGRR